jgi:endonuclease/exonuclease/phosphatase family metal-dependent hydrolase
MKTANRCAVAALLLLASACSGSSTTPTQLSVVSQNLYLGGDIFSIAFAATAEEAAVATYLVWRDVQASNFPARAKVIAAGIAAQNPDVIGLQEVAIWRIGTPVVCLGDFEAINTPVAGTVVYDFLASLQAELLALGLQYEVGALTQSFDAELCAVNPSVGPSSAIDVRYTDRDVILVRKGLSTRNPDGGTYATMVEFPISGTGVKVPDRRAWNVVEVGKSGSWFRVFETHLEVQEIPTPAGVPGFIFQLGQAGELIASKVNMAIALDPIPTILIGDMNTQAEQPITSPLRFTYNFLTGLVPFPDLGVAEFAPLVGVRAPFADAWLSANPGLPGLTWGFDANLVAGTMSQRIDFVLTWGAGPWTMTTFGATAVTATTPPLHGSDHLGVSAQVQLP